MSSPFIRAACGCVVLPLGRPHPQVAALHAVALLWNCEGGAESYGFHLAAFDPSKIAAGRPLTPAEEAEAIGQVARRVSAGDRMQDLWSALHSIEHLNQGRTDASPCKET